MNNVSILHYGLLIKGDIKQIYKITKFLEDEGIEIIFDRYDKAPLRIVTAPSEQDGDKSNEEFVI
jgi:hypothetical protein